jgi:hypothetical protein
MAIPGTGNEPRNSDMLDVLARQNTGDNAALISTAAILVRKRSYPFLLRHHVTNWSAETLGLEEYGSPIFLPEVVPHVIMPGANGMRTVDRGQDPAEAFRDAVATAEKKGWVYVPSGEVISDPALLPKNVGAGLYIRSLASQIIGSDIRQKWYHTAWDIPVATVPEAVQKWRFDRASFNRWRLSLVLRGIIKPPLESVTDEIRDRYSLHVDRAKGSNNPDREHKQAKVQTAQATAAAVLAAKIPGLDTLEKTAPAATPKGGAK